MNLLSNIAGGWWWCDRCKANHVECSPCPNDPDYIPEDPELYRERLEKAIELIKESESRCRCAVVGPQFIQCTPCRKAEADRTWPGYETRGYLGNCLGCNLRFSGPKRAGFCNLCRSQHD